MSSSIAEITRKSITTATREYSNDADKQNKIHMATIKVFVQLPIRLRLLDGSLPLPEPENQEGFREDQECAKFLKCSMT